VARAFRGTVEAQQAACARRTIHRAAGAIGGREPSTRALRNSVPVGQALARIANEKGRVATLRGARKNRSDLRRAATTQNLEALFIVGSLAA
jgi:hypothetical protein